MIAEHTGNPDHSQAGASAAAAVEPIVVEVVRGERRRGAASRRTPSPSRDGEIVESRGDAAARHLLPQLGEADPGAAASSGRGRISTTPRSRSRARRTSHGRSSSTPCGSLLAKAGASEDDLECGAEPTPLEHNCSGKHAAMLLLCRARGWPSDGYRLADAPVPAGDARGGRGGCRGRARGDADRASTAAAS